MSGFVEYPTGQEENPSNVIANSRKRSQVGAVTHRFPKSEAIPYVMVLGFKHYSFSDVNAGAGGFQVINKESIVLPLPLQLNDTTGLEIGSADSSIASTVSGRWVEGQSPQTDSRYYADMTSKGLGASAAALSQSLSPRLRLVGAILGLGAAVTALGTGTTGSLLSGMAINPNETMEFKGVKLKTHSFTWRLSPTSKDDSDAIKDIIETIKRNILPSYVAVAGIGTAHALLQYPNLALISFLGINQNYYYKLKPAFITSFNVRYNGGEQLNVFKGGKPAVIECAMELTEVNIHTSEDYGGQAYVDNTYADLVDQAKNSAALQAVEQTASNLWGGFLNGVGEAMKVGFGG